MTDTGREPMETLERELAGLVAGEGGDGDVSSRLERSITQVARAILRMGGRDAAAAGGVAIDRAGYWLLVRTSELAPVRLSDLAGSVELDLSTVSRQVRDLVDAGLLDRAPDPADGRATLVSLTGPGLAVLEAVSEARRTVLDQAIAGWTPAERQALADGLTRLGTALHEAHECRTPPSIPTPDSTPTPTPTSQTTPDTETTPAR